ncbi:MAG: hypothetical protein EOO41_04635, partial [Methanobacteriota archaeon]
MGGISTVLRVSVADDMEAEEGSLRLLYGALFEVMGRPDVADVADAPTADAAATGAAAGGDAVQVTMRMKDAACPVSSLTLRLERPAGYPAPTAPPRVTCVNSKPVLPPPVLRALNTLLASQCAAAASSKAPIKSVLRWLDNHFTSIFDSIIELQAEAAARGRPAAAHEAVGDSVHTAEQASAQAASVPDAPSEATAAYPAVDSASTEDTLAPRLSQGVRDALNASWTLPEQQALEAVLHTVLVVEGANLSSRETWNAVAQAVGSTKTPSDCLARYLVLRRLTSMWYAGRAPAPPQPEPEPAAPQLGHAAATHSSGSEAAARMRNDNAVVLPATTPEEEGDASDSSTEMRRYRRLAASQPERDLPQLQVKSQARGMQGKPAVKAPVPVTSFADLRPTRGGVHD